MPWFRTSATLDPATLESVKQSVGFDPDVRIIRTDVDRQDVFFNLHPILKPLAPARTFVS
jgi:hypothetical protein